MALEAVVVLAAVWAAVKIGGMPIGRMDATCMQRTRSRSATHGAEVRMGARTLCALPFHSVCTYVSGAASLIVQLSARRIRIGRRRRRSHRAVPGAGGEAGAEVVPASETPEYDEVADISQACEPAGQGTAEPGRGCEAGNVGTAVAANEVVVDFAASGGMIIQPSSWPALVGPEAVNPLHVVVGPEAMEWAKEVAVPVPTPIPPATADTE